MAALKHAAEIIPLPRGADLNIFFVFTQQPDLTRVTTFDVRQTFGADEDVRVKGGGKPPLQTGGSELSHSQMVAAIARGGRTHPTELARNMITPPEVSPLQRQLGEFDISRRHKRVRCLFRVDPGV